MLRSSMIWECIVFPILEKACKAVRVLEDWSRFASLILLQVHKDAMNWHRCNLEAHSLRVRHLCKAYLLPRPKAPPLKAPPLEATTALPLKATLPNAPHQAPPLPRALLAIGMPHKAPPMRSVPLPKWHHVPLPKNDPPPKFPAKYPVKAKSLPQHMALPGDDTEYLPELPAHDTD